MEKNAAVLDIGSGKLSFALGRKNRRGIYTIERYATHRYAGFYRGAWVEEDKLAEEIAVVVGKSGLRGGDKTLYVGVPADFVKIDNNSFLLNFEKEKVISDAVLEKIHAHADRFPAQRGYRLASSAINDYVLDTGEHTLDPLGMSASGVRANLSYVLCREDFCDRIEKCARVCGFEHVEFLSQDWATDKQLIDEAFRAQGAFAADIGFVASSLSFVKGDGLEFLTSAPVGGGCIADDLAYAMEIGFESALAFLPRINLNLDPSDDGVYEVQDEGQTLRFGIREVNEGVRERLAQLANFIKKGLEYAYAQGCRGALRDNRLYVSGGGVAQIRGAYAYLERLIGRQIVSICADVPQYDRAWDASCMALLNAAAELKGSKGIFGRIFG